jgi:hypothetical protein
MRVFAYCAKSFVRTARRAAGVEPITCPPTRTATFLPQWLEGNRFIYLDLHGQPHQGQWYGDDGYVAMTAEQVQQASLEGSVVFAVNCYLANEGSPMLDALLDAGAEYVIGGWGPNYGGQRGMIGANALGWWVRLGMQAGLKPLTALAGAKRLLRARWVVNKAMRRGNLAQADLDALGFRAFYRRET